MNHDIRQLQVAAALRDGTPVTIRAVRPDDRDRLLAFFHGLDPESVYMRLFRYKKDLTEDELTRLSVVDFERQVTLVATVGGENGGPETVIGGASWVVLDAPGQPAARAEVAFTIEEDYQGQGLASMLFARLIGLARAQGLRTFEADVLSTNVGMLKVFARAGLPTTQRREAGVLHLEMALEPVAG